MMLILYRTKFFEAYKIESLLCKAKYVYLLTLKKAIKNITDYLLKGKIDLAFKAVPLKHLSEQLRKDVSLLSYRFNFINLQFNEGLLSFDEFMAMHCRIAASLLSQIEAVKVELRLLDRYKKNLL